MVGVGGVCCHGDGVEVYEDLGCRGDEGVEESEESCVTMEDSEACCLT